MADFTLPLIPLVPATLDLDISPAINTLDDQGLDLNEADNLISLPSTDEPSPLTTSSSSSSSCSPPSSSGSLDSLSSNTDTRDDEIKQESLSCDTNELSLPENDSLPHQFCFLLTFASDTSPQQQIPRPDIDAPPPPTPSPPPQQQQQHLIPDIDTTSSQQQTPRPENDTSPSPSPTPQLPVMAETPVVREMIIDHFLLEAFSIVTILGRPTRLGYFSCFSKPNGKRMYKEDKSSLRYLFIPNDKTVALNLREGYTENLCLDQSHDALFILNYISENEFDLSQKGFDDDDEDDDNDQEDNPIADIVCSSEVLTLLMVTPYNKQKDWVLIGIKVRGALILLEKETTEPPNPKKQYESRKFLEGVTRLHDQSKTHSNGTYDCFYSVCRVKVNKHMRLLYTFPIDAAVKRSEADNKTDSMGFAHLEARSTNWDKDGKSKKKFWRNTGLNVWCSSLLGKVEYIIFGGKEPGNWVKHVDKAFKPEEIPKSSNGWSPKTCVDFMYQALTHILTTAPLPNELEPFEIRYIHNSDNQKAKIICTPLDEPAEKYIPSWYINNESPDEHD